MLITYFKTKGVVFERYNFEIYKGDLYLDITSLADAMHKEMNKLTKR
jgi:hypothetical protein